MKRRIVLMPIVALALAATIGAPAYAYELTSGDQLSVERGTTVYGTYYAAGNALTIDGDVRGDVICAGRTVTINGAVGGDVLCAAESITINGTVDGDVRVAASDVTLNGRIEHNVNVFASSVTTGRDSVVSGSLMTQAGATRLAGRIGGEAYGNASTLNLEGPVDGRVRYDAQTVAVGSGARLGAGLAYTSVSDARIAEDAEITGQTKRTDPPKPQPRPIRDIIAAWLTSLLTALATGLIILWLWPRAARGTLARFRRRPGTTALVGLVALILTPIVALVVMITVVGLPAGLILLGLWLAALYVARVVAGLALGSALQRRFAPQATTGRYGWGTLGVVVAWIVFAIPVIGFLASAMAVLVGLGAIALAARDHVDHEESKTEITTS